MDCSTSISASKLSNKNGRIPWPEAPSMKQIFSLPDSIIYYITKNPSTPKVYLKLAQSCKYFFEKNPFLIVARIYLSEALFCSNDKKECTKKNGKCCVKIDAAKITAKIWFTSHLEFCILISSLTPLLLSKFYERQNAYLKLSFIIITLKDLELLASKFQKFYFFAAKVVDKDGNAVMLEKILESIPNVKELDYYTERNNPAVTASTIKNISKLQNLGNLQSLSLRNIPEVLNVKDFGEFIKQHRNLKIRLNFAWYLSKEYKNQLDGLVGTVIATEHLRCIVNYPGQDCVKFKIMDNRYHSH